MATTQNPRIFLIIILGFLAAFGPFVTDMYLPALPEMTNFFNATISKVQLGITTSMIGLSIGQLLVGLISDKFGRRTPLIISMWFFMVSTFLCIIAWDINSFVFFRLLQGLAGAGGIVLSRSISADLFSGVELAKFFAIIAAVQGLAPILAPIVGGLMLSFTTWQGIFWTLFALGFILLVMCYFYKETHPVEKRTNTKILNIFSLMIPVLKNRRFMLYVFLLSFAMAVMFAYISASPFIFQDFYKLSPLTYGIYFGVNAFAITLGSILSSYLRSADKSIKIGSFGMLVMAIIAASFLFLQMKFIFVSIQLFLLLISAGLIFPASAALAIECERKNSGTASAVLGATNFILGGIVTPLVGLGNIMTSTGVTLIICALIVFMLMIASSRMKSRE